MNKFLNGSWKTTAAGIMLAVSILLTNASAALDNDPTTTFNWDSIVAAAGALGLGVFSRDNDKTSESVGAK